MSKSGAHCHMMVAKTAQEMAAVLYDEVMLNDEWYATWQAKHPDASPRGLQEAFVKKNWSQMVEGARATLAKLLTSSLDDVIKDQIAEALILDKTLVKGRIENHQLLN